MGLFSFFRKSNQNNEPAPWDNRPAIYEFLKSNVDKHTGKLSSEDIELPDEKPQDGKVKWAAGAMDGVFGHHALPGKQEDLVQQTVGHLQKIAMTGDASSKREVYRLLTENEALSVVDQVIEKLSQEETPLTSHLQNFIHFLAKEAPDREPVKFGIALLGVTTPAENRDYFLIMGCLDEFTLYAAVALLANEETREEDLWKLAQSVDGWGRIQTLERLTPVSSKEIKDWLIREGYKNSIMYEYTAYTCAVYGDLAEALSQKDVDPELLAGSTDILTALLVGGPAEDIGAYDHAPKTISAYLKHLKSANQTSEHYLLLVQLKEYLLSPQERHGDDNPWDEQTLTTCQNSVDQLLSNNHWHATITAELSSADRFVFDYAKRAAQKLGISTWDILLEKTRQDPIEGGYWFDLMVQADEKRVQELVAEAEALIPLDKIATGPALSNGFGDNYQLYNSIDYIVQELDKHPGIGWPLIQASLQAPAIRNRNIALKTIAAWGEDNWPKKCRALLEQAAKIEPDEDIKERFQKVLAGEPIK